MRNIMPLFRMLSTSFTPLLLMVSAWLALEQVPVIDARYLPLLKYVPLLVLALAMVLAYRFNRARVLSLAFMLLLTSFVVQQFLQQPLSELLAHAVYTALSLLLPANLLLILLLPDKGVRHLNSLLLLALMPLQAAVLWQALKISPVAVTDFLTLFPVKTAEYTVLSVPAMLWQLTVLVLLFAWTIWRRPTAGVSVMTALLALFVLLAWLQKPYISSVMLSTAGLMLIIDLLNSSYNMAYRDELTGIHGRRALNEALNSLGKSYSVAMIDIDHFKRFNDTYGHDAGDDVLVLVARKLATVGGGGKVYRYGGEEFTILFPRASIELVTGHLEAVREAIANYPMVIRNQSKRPKSNKQGVRQRGRNAQQKTVSVTVSIGLAERGEGLSLPEQVIKAADGALYKAKKKGRNCLAVCKTV